MLPALAIERRIEELEGAIADEHAAMPWMHAVVKWHAYWRTTLEARRQDLRVQGDRIERRPPRGELRSRALDIVAAQLGISTAELATLLWPRE